MSLGLFSRSQPHLTFLLGSNDVLVAEAAFLPYGKPRVHQLQEKMA